MDIKGDVYLDWMYPQIYGGEKGFNYVTLGMCHVRAADNIRIHYDSDRDGWSIEQASVFSWDGNDPVCDPDWQEVAFVQAWAREKKEQPATEKPNENA